MRVCYSLLTAALVAAALGVTTAGNAATTAACPPSKPAPAVAWRSGSAAALVPRGAVGVLLCRYRGLNPPGTSGRLFRSRLITATSTVRKLTAELDAIPPTKPGVVFSCPMDDGDAVLAIFDYRAGPPDAVTVDLTGCTTATNGRVTRMAGTAIVAQLEALTT